MSMICFDAAEQRAYQDRIDIQDAESERLGEIHAELFDAFNTSFDKPDAQVPCVQHGFRPGDSTEVTMPINEAIAACFLDSNVIAFLRLLIKEPNLINAAKLRLLMASVYAEDNFESIAEARK